MSAQNAAFIIASLLLNRILRKLVLAPLNRVEVNTLLNELPQRAQFPQEVDALSNRIQDVVNFTVGGEAANAETDTAVSALITAAERSEDVARLEGCGGAGTTRRKGDILESHQERLAFDVRKRDVDTARVVARRITVQSSVLHAKEAISELLGERSDALAVILLPKSAIELDFR